MTSDRISELIEALGVDDGDIIVEAIDELVSIGEPAIPELIEALGNGDEFTQCNAASTLGYIGKGGDDVIAALMNSLSNEQGSWEVWFHSAWALAKVDSSKLNLVLPILEDTLSSEYWELRRKAVETLGMLGSEAKAAVPSLIKALNDEDDDVRMYTVDALGKIGEPAKSSIPALIKALNEEDEWIREYTACALGKMGEEAVPALAIALADEDEGVSDSARESLFRIGTSEARKVLEEHWEGRLGMKLDGEDFLEFVTMAREGGKKEDNPFTFEVSVELEGN